MISAARRTSADWLSDRDKAVLTSVGAFRLMTGGQLKRLFFSEHGAGSSNPRIARRCLQRLTDLGLLHRLERRQGGLRAGSSSYTYALTPAGGRVIDLHIGRGQQREPSLTFVRHTLAVAEVGVQLHEAHRCGEIDGLAFETEPRCWRNLGGSDGALLKPDLFVTVAKGDVEHLAWLEVDLGTEHGPRLLRKAGLYERHFRSGREQERLGAYPRVVWLASDDKRAQFVEQTLASSRRLTAGLHRVGLLSAPLATVIGATTNEKGGQT